MLCLRTKNRTKSTEWLVKLYIFTEILLLCYQDSSADQKNVHILWLVIRKSLANSIYFKIKKNMEIKGQVV